MEIVVRTLAGLEQPLANEINKICGVVVSVNRRAVVCEGDQEVLYRLNYWSRLALDVLIPISKFTIKDENDLYDKVKRINWRNYMSSKSSFSISSVIHSSRIANSHYATLKAKDAIVDFFREKTGVRPNVDKKRADIKITLRISEKHCSILLNSSGEPLFKRGYRQMTGEAPINEVLAAGIIELSGWDAKSTFVDPMCGSGTFLIEAAMRARNIPPGFYRKQFGFQKWNDFDSALWEKIKSEAKKGVKNEVIQIKGFEKDFKVLRLARKNISSLPEIASKISIEQADFFSLKPTPRMGKGILVFNPPYDKRIEIKDAVEFYSEIGNSLKHNWGGWYAWIISSNIMALKRIGLKPSSKIKLFNGGDESNLIELKLYDGSKKRRNSQE